MIEFAIRAILRKIEKPSSNTNQNIGSDPIGPCQHFPILAALWYWKFFRSKIKSYENKSPIYVDSGAWLEQ